MGAKNMVYKVSYVVLGGGYPGAIINEFEQPEVGQQVKIGKNTFEIVEINELMPARGDFAFLHATVKLVEAKPAQK
jgi:hypothetical protein